MSHGPASGSGIKAEPNLTPLLDMVLQLLMFFMMCVNFVNDQVNKDIKLPVAQSARPGSKNEDSVRFLNMDRSGALVTTAGDKLLTPGDITYYLKREYADAERENKLKGGTGEVKTAIIIRADQEASYKDVYQLLQLCKQERFKKLNVRAMTQAGGPPPD
jgi:biopolymer transport protein ExbD